MIPEHCKNVSIRSVEYKLTHDNIKKELLDSKIYKGTEYLILNDQNDWAVIRVGKTPRRSLFWLITNLEIISLPEDTVYVTDPSIDVLNINAMSTISKKLPGKTVIVQGKFEHVSFVKDEIPIDLVVFDVIPPAPAKLIELMKDTLKFVTHDKPINIIEKIVDINSMLESSSSELLILPCHASGMKTTKKILFLDERPNIDNYEKDSITLIGCDLSLKIFRELYKFTPEFINICPIKLIPEMPAGTPILIKCCNVKAFKRQDNIYQVPWGVTYDDLKNVIPELIKNTE